MLHIFHFVIFETLILVFHLLNTSSTYITEVLKSNST